VEDTVSPRFGPRARWFENVEIKGQHRRSARLDRSIWRGCAALHARLWNAARFLQGNGVGASTSVAAPEATLAVNKWIIGEVVETLAKLDAAFADLRYDAMADAIYHFAWGTFCDWYIELVKGAFDDETRAVAAWAFDQILVMLHPFMPFITEELWGSMGERISGLIHAQWPVPDAAENPITGVEGSEGVDAKAYFRSVIGTIVAVRSAKNELGIAPGLRLTACVEDSSSSLWENAQFRQMLERVGRISILASGSASTGPAMRIALGGATLVVPLEGIIDLAAERTRLTKSADAAEKEAASLAARLANPAFVEKAKPEAIEKARADHAEKSAEAERLRAALARLG
jgi:valyl-tRNA synthetase